MKPVNQTVKIENRMVLDSQKQTQLYSYLNKNIIQTSDSIWDVLKEPTYEGSFYNTHQSDNFELKSEIPIKGWNDTVHT